MRLIDAEELYKKTAEWEAWASENVEMLNKQERVIESLKWDAILAERSSFKREVMDAPTVDAVPVVRCKECKFWQDNNGGYPHEDCKWNHDETPDEDDYCSGGERRDSNDTNTD